MILVVIRIFFTGHRLNLAGAHVTPVEKEYVTKKCHKNIQLL